MSLNKLLDKKLKELEEMSSTGGEGSEEYNTPNAFSKDEEDENDEPIEEEMFEFSGVGAVGGYALPLGGTDQDLEDMKKIGFGIKK